MFAELSESADERCTKLPVSVRYIRQQYGLMNEMPDGDEENERRIVTGA